MVNVNPASGGGDPVQAYTWQDVLGSLIAGQDLDRAAAAWAMDQVMSGEASHAQIAGLLVGLRAKGETVAEVAGLVDSMYAHAVTIDVPGPIVDIVGTGGDRARTVNIPTMSAVVAAGAGARVVKHGNRAASSRSGASDVLEHLGIRLDLPPARVAEIAVEAGITYCPAPVFHASMRHAAPVRGPQGLGLPTVFNFLGPLTNPARAECAAIGVFDYRMAGIMAGVLAERGTSALVFRGDDGLDELTVSGTSHLWQVRDGKVEETVLDPARLGIGYAPIEALRGGDPAHNAEVARRILGGEQGPVRDAVLLNTAAALVSLQQTDAPLLEQFAVGIARAAESIDSGAAAKTLARWSEATSRS